MRELRVEDALLYLDQVKVEFGDRPHIYNEFLDIMKTFKTQQIDTPGVIRRVSNLFQGNRRLVLGFNTFLPEGYKIEIPMDGDGPPVAVYRAPGSSVAHILRESAESQAVSVAAAAAASQSPAQYHPGGMPQGQNRMPLQSSPTDPGLAYGGPNMGGPNRQQQQQPTAKSILPHDAGGVAPRVQRPAAAMEAQAQQIQQLPGGVAPRQPKPQAALGRPAMPHLQQQQRGLDGPQQANGGAPMLNHAASGGAPAFGDQNMNAGQPLEFDHAINYVTTIKRRFAAEPETYKKFLEILHTYQKEQRGIKEVLDEVSELFEDHPDLLKEFTFFLPDAVQAAAKVQLDQVAKEAEARKHSKAKAAIMNTAQGMQRQAQTIRQTAAVGGSKIQPHEIHSDRIAAPSGGPYPQPARSSVERENSISRGAQHGTVMFEPVRPPRKNEMTPAVAALKNGRPTSVPELPKLPNRAEAAFFQRAKNHLSRKELAADKPAGSRRHTPYTEFLKCLHLFGAGILNKEELVLLLKGLFLQGHAPKTGANATGGNHNPAVANAASDLMRDFEEILIGRGPYADQQTALKDKSKYGSLRIRDFDFSNCKQITPSYRTFPSDYPHDLFISNPGQNHIDSLVLNDELVCIDPAIGFEDNGSAGTRGGKQRKRKVAPSREESDGSKKRHNVYEEAIFRIEDERYELDMAIERNVHALRRIEPFAKEAQAFREQEEKDGQPIGRLRYQLHRFSLNTIHINAIGRIYGDRGDEILQHLLRNPLIVLPIVYQRLKQKDTEWRKAKAELTDKWNAICEANYEGSMDAQCYFNRKALEKSFTTSRLLDQCKRARSYVKHPEKIKDHPVTRLFAPTFGKRVAHSGALLYQPYMEVQCKVNISHKHAFQMIVHKIKVASDVTVFDRERIGRIWAEFVLPWFQYPTHWVLDEVRDSFGGKLGPSVTKFSSGQRVCTIFGEGTIASFMEASVQAGPRYRVKLPFGLGHLAPSAILYAVPSKDTPYIRRDGIMVRDEASLYEDVNAPKLDSRYQLLFATEKIYLFVRLYSLLCSVLSDTREHCDTYPPPDDPADSYITPTGKSGKKKSRKLDYSSLLIALKKVLANDMTARDFEALARKISREKVHQIAALPALVGRCVDALVRVADEDTLLHLYDHCQYKNVDPVAMRTQCLSIVPDAFFRIQFDAAAGNVRCCYLESGPLLTSPRDDDGEIEEDTNMDTGDDPMEEDPIEDFDDVNGGAAPPETKRARVD